MRDRERVGHEADADGLVAQHWGWRPDWTPERRNWWWYATFAHDPSVRRLAAAARAVIKPWAPVDLVSDRWLHLTVAELGYAADFPRDLAYECARRAHTNLARLGTFDLQLGPVDTMPGAVVLRAHADPLRDLYDGLVEVIDDLRPGRVRQRPFDPHVSVAYLHRDCRRGELLSDEVLGTRPSAPRLTGTTRLDRLTLVEVVRDERHYRWTPRCVLTLPRSPDRHLRKVG